MYFDLSYFWIFSVSFCDFHYVLYILAPAVMSLLLVGLQPLTNDGPMEDASVSDSGSDACRPNQMAGWGHLHGRGRSGGTGRGAVHHKPFAQKICSVYKQVWMFLQGLEAGSGWSLQQAAMLHVLWH